MCVCVCVCVCMYMRRSNLLSVTYIRYISVTYIFTYPTFYPLHISIIYIYICTYLTFYPLHIRYTYMHLYNLLSVTYVRYIPVSYICTYLTFYPLIYILYIYMHLYNLLSVTYIRYILMYLSNLLSVISSFCFKGIETYLIYSNCFSL